MSKSKVQVIGLTRWSYPFKAKGFRQSGGAIEDVRARLYAPNRLDHRLFLLEHVLLPGLRDQSDPNFTHLMLIGDKLPQPWLDRILELVRDIPQIVPLVRPEGEKHQDLCREIMLEHIDSNCDAIVQHRLDDDDGIGTKFVERTRRLFNDLSNIYEESGSLALDFSKGFVLRSNADGIRMEPVSMRFWAPGMAIVTRPDTNRTLLDYNHLKVWHGMPTFMWPEEPMFIRGAHHDNDSHLATFGRRTRGFKFNQKNPARYFRMQFGIKIADIERIWDQEKDHFLADKVASKV